MKTVIVAIVCLCMFGCADKPSAPYSAGIFVDDSVYWDCNRGKVDAIFWAHKEPGYDTGWSALIKVPSGTFEYGVFSKKTKITEAFVVVGVSRLKRICH